VDNLSKLSCRVELHPVRFYTACRQDVLQDKNTIPGHHRMAALLGQHCHPRVKAETAFPSGTKMELNENGNSSVTKPSPW
jgi:hypothetical protein